MRGDIHPRDNGFRYDGISDAWLRRPALLCAPCANGDHHEITHAEIGCLAVIGKRPNDWVCKCEVTSAIHAEEWIPAGVFVDSYITECCAESAE